MQRRYQLQNRNNNHFMEFVSGEMMRGKRNRSYAEYPKNRNQSRVKEARVSGYEEIYSQGQLIKQRRGASVLRNSSKYRNSDHSMSKMRKEFKDTSLNFYEGVKSKNLKSKPKEETTPTIKIQAESEVDIEDLHYQMVKMQQNVRKMQNET